MWGSKYSKQDHYTAGRSIKEVELEDIEGLCNCGYLTLRAKSEFEEQHGGLTVKRKNVKIMRKNGSVVKRYRGHRYYACNACANHWK